MESMLQFLAIALFISAQHVSPSYCTDKLFVAEAKNAEILMAEAIDYSFFNTTFVKIPLNGLVFPVGVEFDPRSELLYWTDAILHTVNRAALDGSSQEVIAQLQNTSGDYHYPYGIALNLDDDRVYWTDQYRDVIEMANLDGTNRTDLLTTGYNAYPNAIVYSSFRRKIYWTDRGQHAKLEMANPDGTGRETLLDGDIDSNFTDPTGICLDSIEQKLYWTDTTEDRIENLNLDDLQRFVNFWTTTDELDLHPFGIAKYFEDIYFADIILNGVYAIDFPVGNIFRVNRQLPTPTEIHIYADASCPGSNLCASTGTCVLYRRQPLVTYVCNCDKGYNGTYCELDINDCDPDSCMNGGTCTDGVDSFTCDCVAGYADSTCSTRIDLCLNNNPCGVNEKCTNTDLTEVGYYCNCSESFERMNGLCMASRIVGASVKFTRLNGQVVTFTDALKDPKSEEYRNLESICYNILYGVLLNIMSTQSWDIAITRFTEGSIITDFEVKVFDPDRSVLNDQAAAVETSLGLQQPGVWQSDDGSVSINVESIVAYGEICLTVPCSNGMCITSPGDINYRCICQYGYTGEHCETEVTCPLPSHPFSHVLMPESFYRADDFITIQCDEKDESVVWQCNGTSGQWNQLADLQCESDDGTTDGFPTGAIIGIAIAVAVVLVLGMIFCFLYKMANKKRPTRTTDIMLSEQHIYQPPGTQESDGSRAFNAPNGQLNRIGTLPVPPNQTPLETKVGPLPPGHLPPPYGDAGGISSDYEDMIPDTNMYSRVVNRNMYLDMRR